MTSIEKGNIGENFVNKIAFNSFFEYWCYPNPKDEDGDKKEIAPFSKKKEREIQKDIELLGWFKNLEQGRIKEQEYPQ